MIDTLVSHYRITGLLGAGGMGEVYRADDTRLPRQVALKFLAAGFADDELARSRFEREAQTAASLSHPNICAIYDIGIHQGLPYIVMELLSGQTLKQLIRSGPLRPERVIALTLELADALATAHDLGIIHRDIGRQLNASYVLEGSFRISGSRIRISANFINVGDGFQIWSDRFDRDMDDVFAVQDEIAQTIAGALEVTLTGRTQKPGLARATEHVEAYDHYLRGRFHWKKRTPDAIRKAIENFKEALEIDPNYAAAHAGLADCYAMLGIYAVMPRQEVMPQARAAAERALELDDSIAEAHSAIGLVAAIHDFDWATAESRFQKALTLAPDNATARYWYAMFVLLPNSRFEEALGQARWAADLDPVNPGICAATGLIYYMRGEHDRALEELDAALELEPTHPLSNIIAAYASIASGRPDDALLKLKHCQSMRVVATGARAWAMLVSNKRAAAEELLEELKQMSQQGNTQSDFEMARVYVGLGETELALDCLEKTYEQRSGALYWLNVNHYFDPLRSSPRFNELLKKLGLSG